MASSPSLPCGEAAPSSPAPEHALSAALLCARQAGFSTLVEAVNWYRRHRPDAGRDIPLEAGVDRYLWNKTKTCAPATVHAHRTLLACLIAQHPALSCAAVESGHISDFLKPWSQPHERRHRWHVLARFFRWAQSDGLIATNPMEALGRAPSVPRGQRHILRLPEVRYVLAAAKPTEVIGYWVLAFFAGLQSTEMAAWQRQADRWALVDWQRRLLSLPTELTRREPRTVSICPVLFTWLQWMREHHRPILPPNFNHKCAPIRRQLIARHFRQWRSLGRAEERTLRGYPPSFRFGRVAYLAYRTALGDIPVSQLADETGVWEETIATHYLNRIPRPDARRYFALGPDQV